VFVQKPQLNGSVMTFVQLAPHWVKPVAHVDEHIPWEQSSPFMQTVPHAPQFAGSDAVFAQPVVQAMRPAVHAHWPTLQLWPTPHLVPHVPQLLRSVVVVVQTPLQLVWPTAQLAPAPVPPIGGVPAVPPVPVPATPPVPVPPLPLSLSPPPVGLSCCAEQLPIEKRAPAAIAANTKRACMAGILTHARREDTLESS
jgi:hypothetical protein